MNYGDIIEYKDGTRDLHFEEAMKWAREHNTTFEEDVNARKLPLRFFIIGQEPVIPEPTEQEKIMKKVEEAHQFLTSTDWCIVKIAEAETVAEQAELREKYTDTIKKRKEARELINEYENSKED